MAYFRTSVAFNVGIVDFHAPLLDPAVTVDALQNQSITVHLGPQYVAVGPLAFRVIGFDGFYNSELMLTTSDLKIEYVYGDRLTFDAMGQITGGTVGGVGFDLGGSRGWGIVGTSVGGAAFGLAMTSADAADDRALFATLFAGNDRIVLSGYSDSIDAGGGRDLILANGGNDTVIGGAGNDLIDGGRGNDLLNGGTFNDLIFGGDGRDTVQGAAGNDTLGGGLGFDTLTGGVGADDFVFGANFSDEAATVTDFRRGVDKVLVFFNLDDLTIIQRAAGAEISYTDAINNHVHKMLLQGIVAANLTGADFIPLQQAELGQSFSAFYTNWHYFG